MDNNNNNNNAYVRVSSSHLQSGWMCFICHLILSLHFASTKVSNISTKTERENWTTDVIIALECQPANSNTIKVLVLFIHYWFGDKFACQKTTSVIGQKQQKYSCPSLNDWTWFNRLKFGPVRRRAKYSKRVNCSVHFVMLCENWFAFSGRRIRNERVLDHRVCSVGWINWPTTTTKIRAWSDHVRGSTFYRLFVIIITKMERFSDEIHLMASSHNNQ